MNVVILHELFIIKLIAGITYAILCDNMAKSSRSVLAKIVQSFVFEKVKG